MLQFNTIEVTWVRSKVPAVILAVVLLLLATPFFIPSNVYQNLIEERIEKSTGLDLTFGGKFSFSLFPAIRLEADKVEFSGNLALGVQTIGSIQEVTVDMDLLQFLSGNIHMNDFLLQSPNVTINGDFMPFIPDWIRNNLSAARKEDVRYLEVLMHFIEESVFNIARVNEGTVLWQKNADEQVNAQKLNLSIEKPKGGKEFSISGNVYVNDRSVDLAMRLQHPDDFIRGFRSKLSMRLDSTPLQIEFIGNAAHRQSFVAQGDMRVEIPSRYEFCSWFNPDQICPEETSKVLITSNLKLRDQRLQIDGAEYSDGDFDFTANGAVDFKTITPNVIGTVLVPPRPIKKISKSFSRFKKANFDSLLLEAFDANVDVKYQGLSMASGDTITPHLKVLLDGGHLTISSNKLDMFGGISNMRLRWHKGLQEGYMDLRFDTNSFDLERFQNAIGEKYDTTGTLRASLEVQAQGGTIDKLLETARIHGEFSILDGAFLNPDVIVALNGEKIDQFEFAEIKGRFKGDQGHVSSKDIKFIAPFVDINGLANYDIVNDQLKIHLTSDIPQREDVIGDAIIEQQQGFVSVTGQLDNLLLVTSVNEGVAVAETQGLHSGLIPNTDEEDPIIADDDQVIIEETDLFD